jgi:hypothetical protein
VEGLGDVSNVAGVKAGDRDAAIGSHVNGILLTKLINHLLVQAGEGEHADLVNKMFPRVLTTEILKVLFKAVAHLNNATRHQLEVVMPHLGELFIAENDVNDTGAMNRRI